MATRAAMSIVATLLVACGADAVPPEAPPADAVTGLRASAAVVLEIGDVAADAIDDTALSTLLEDAGFESAIERSYAGGAGPIRHVEVRVVGFATADGAERYRSWLTDHARDVIGAAEAAPGLAVPSTVVLVHEPDACCPRETALAFAVWRDGRRVVRAVIAGPEADGPATTAILESLTTRTP